MTVVTVVTVVMVRLHHIVYYLVQGKVGCLGSNELESDSERRKLVLLNWTIWCIAYPECLRHAPPGPS